MATARLNQVTGEVTGSLRRIGIPVIEVSIMDFSIFNFYTVPRSAFVYPERNSLSTVLGEEIQKDL